MIASMFLWILTTAAVLGAERILHAGPLVMEIEVSRTANLFHVVDQLSSWSEFTHAQYRRYIPHDARADARALARHARLRAARGWGGGFEQTFYTSADLDRAIEDGVGEGHITRREARIERRVLLRFGARVDALLSQEEETLLAFRIQVESRLDELDGLATRLSHYCGVPQVRVPVFLLANPAEFYTGGGYNGGRLTLEVPAKGDAWGSFTHEILHAFLEGARPRLRAAAASVPGLDEQTLEEGIAYALSPGILNGGGDPLADDVARLRAQGRTLRDPYLRFSALGLALRPHLAAGLADEESTIEDLFPLVSQAWLDLSSSGAQDEVEAG